jgi:hypothetical protein
VFKLLAAPATNDRGPRYMERALAAIHQADPDDATVTLFYATTAGRVGLFVQCPDSADELVCGPIAANYPNCSLTTIERLDEPPPGWTAWTAELELSPEISPILRHAQFEDLLNGTFADPINGILRAIKPTADVRCHVSIHIAPASRRRRQIAAQAVRLLDREFFRRHHKWATYYAEHVTRSRGWSAAWLLGRFARRSPRPVHTALDTSASRLHDREEDLQAAAGKVGGHLFDAHIQLVALAAPEFGDLAMDRLRQLAGAFGSFTQSRLATFHLRRIRLGPARSPTGWGSLLSHEEVATLFHPPTATVAAEQMQTAEFRELEPPPQFCDGGDPRTVTLGRVLFRTGTRLVAIDEEARRRHLYVVGSTGTGKSTLLLNLIHQDMLAGRGVTVIDVHGDLSNAVIERVPTHRTNDAIVFEAAADRVILFNPLACPDPARVDQVTSGAVSALKKLFESWGPRLESLLRSGIFTVVEQGGTLLDLLRLLTDRAYRDAVVSRTADDVIRAFWTDEFAHWNSQYRTEAVSSVTNKLAPFLTSRQLRAITSGAGRSLDLRRVMDEQQILIVNLSRGLLGQDNSTVLGSLLLTSIEQAAMTRADVSEADRTDHHLYLDEFQSLVTPSTAIMLSESRKYRLCLTLSHQLTRQLDPPTYHAVVGNCGSMLAFRVGMEDADLLAPAFSKHPGQLAPGDLCNLPNFTAYLRLLTPDGQPSRPFSVRTLPAQVPAGDEDRSEIVRRTSARRWATRAASAPTSPANVVPSTRD